MTTPTPIEQATAAGEKLIIPAASVGQLLEWALQTQPGAAWFNGFVTGKDSPTWIAERQWVIEPAACAIVKAARPAQQQPPRPQDNGRL